MPNWYAFFTYVAISGFTPGPNNITCMNNGIKMGLRKTLGYCFGVWFGYGIIMILAGLFGARLFQMFPIMKTVIQWVGVVYLLWLAYTVLISSSSKGGAYSAPHTFWPAVAIQFINIKGVFFALTTNTVFIVPYFKDFWMLALLSFAVAFVGFVATIVWALFGSMFQSFLVKHEKASNAVMSALLVYCAVMLFL